MAGFGYSCLNLWYPRMSHKIPFMMEIIAGAAALKEPPAPKPINRIPVKTEVEIGGFCLSKSIRIIV